MVKTFLRLLIGAIAISTAACGPSQSGYEILPDENLTVEGEEAPLNKISPLLDIMARMTEPKYTPAEAARILAQYDHLDPQNMVPTGLLERAVLYFHANRAVIPNRKFISVIDYAPHSSRKRFFVIDLKNGSVWGIRTAHGSGSDPNNNGLLDRFSNIDGSHASSRGYMLTAETYYGKYGRALRLDGLSATNANVRARAVVVHGSNYVEERDVQQGRSWGCPAVSMAIKDKLIDKIAGGSLIYAGLSPEHWTPSR